VAKFYEGFRHISSALQIQHSSCTPKQLQGSKIMAYRRAIDSQSKQNN
jgi:hypothetical protein